MSYPNTMTGAQMDALAVATRGECERPGRIEPVGVCDNCGEPIMPGTDVYDVGGERYCAQCWDDRNGDILDILFGALPVDEKMELLNVKVREGA